MQPAPGASSHHASSAASVEIVCSRRSEGIWQPEVSLRTRRYLGGLRKPLPGWDISAHAHLQCAGRSLGRRSVNLPCRVGNKGRCRSIPRHLCTDWTAIHSPARSSKKRPRHPLAAPIATGSAILFPQSDFLRRDQWLLPTDVEQAISAGLGVPAAKRATARPPAASTTHFIKLR